MLKVASVVQQIVIELNGAVSQEAKIFTITKIVLNLMKQNGPSKTEFNANDIMRQRCELKKQLQEKRIDVSLFSETHLKLHERFYISNYYLYRTDHFPGIEGETAVAVKKGIPHSYQFIYLQEKLGKMQTSLSS
jgi:hypothetical protein